MLETIKDLASIDSRHVVFGAACFDHGLCTSPGYNIVNVNGITAQDQLLAFLQKNNSRLNAISTCQDVNCETSCRQIEFGSNSMC
jgi:hypothetical protein